MKRPTLCILAVALTTACGRPQTLEELNEELNSTPPEQALTNAGHFRPLCDSNGYPVVGNLNGKVVSPAQEFCAEVRLRERKP